MTDERLDGLVASLADCANTWAREWLVPECEQPYTEHDLRDTIERLWDAAAGIRSDRDRLVDTLAAETHRHIERVNALCAERDRLVDVADRRLALLREVVDSTSSEGWGCFICGANPAFCADDCHLAAEIRAAAKEAT